MLFCELTAIDPNSTRWKRFSNHLLDGCLLTVSVYFLLVLKRANLPNKRANDPNSDLLR